MLTSWLLAYLSDYFCLKNFTINANFSPIKEQISIALLTFYYIELVLPPPESYFSPSANTVEY